MVWGFAIANYVWWIGIGNAGTLISALLLLTRQRWRASINRFAEAMTLFAASIAGLFPDPASRPALPCLLAGALSEHDGALAAMAQRPGLGLRSPSPPTSCFSLLFWYLGLIPDLATMRDRARSRGAQLTYGVLALGWRGSARHWQRHDALSTGRWPRWRCRW